MFCAKKVTKLPDLTIYIYLRGHDNEADFLGFCIIRFLMSPFHDHSSHSDFGFEFAEILVTENNSPTCRLGESTRLPIQFLLQPLNKSMVIVNYFPVCIFFAKLVL
jgi:hypothetical protein